MKPSMEKELQGLGISDRVCFVGFKSEVQRLLAGSDLTIAPAVNEGFGRAVVESMMVGTPVVAAASGGHTSIIDHGRTGLLFEPDNFRSLFHACVTLIDDSKLRDHIATRAKEAATERYPTDKHVEAIAAIYSEL